ncbi:MULTISPECIES: HAD family hydrolase [unclassified Spirosoma]|uniref:HAD family hydrolase n=1 Tax=unclassified Spirosoma TaxID=2621999 RepID=UPI0009602879|nr:MULTISPECIES: HAD family hydrolase [unclassified Spirosoma]MBN8824022.1 HAD family hydrolase [Spirosoma sp.]OJW70427.1 MAG: haloacid dehalogenase [Spirosoma sp. 48-14]
MKLIAFDADDTLWVNEPNYVDVKQKLCDLLAHHIDEETLSSRFYETQMRNMNLFGYGAKSFILSMIETAIQLTDGAITGSEIQQIIDTGRQLINYPIDVLDGIPEVLETLSKNFDLMLLTKGDLFDQESKIARSGLGHYFRHMEIVSEKNEQAYQRVLQKYNVKPADFIMIGNSLKSDILPVVHIGGHAIHIPYSITWIHERVEDEQLVGKSFTTLESARELLALF